MIYQREYEKIKIISRGKGKAQVGGTCYLVWL